MNDNHRKPGLLKRLGSALLLGGALASTTSGALAETEIRFTLDWRFEGPSAPFLMALEKGYFADEGLDVTIDSGNGSAGAVTRVATNSYDMGFADYSALTETTAKNPDTGVTGVYMVYNAMPAAVFASRNQVSRRRKTSRARPSVHRSSMAAARPGRRLPATTALRWMTWNGNRLSRLSAKPCWPGVSSTV